MRELLALLSFLMPKVFKMEYIDYLYDSFMERFIDIKKKGDGASSSSSLLSKKRGDSSRGSNSASAQPGKAVSSGDSSESEQPRQQEPQLKEEDHHASASSLHELRCMLAPFVLRRLKSDVLRQMPPKIGECDRHQ